MPRQPGQRTSAEDKATWSMERLIKETKKLIRTDWGGQIPRTKVIDQLVERGVDFSTASTVANAVVEITEKQCGGSRDRCESNFDEMLRRVTGKST